MTKLEVFDPAMCCSTGVARHNLAQEPAAFVANATVRDLIGRWGASCLPLVLHNQKIVTRGRYPSRSQLAAAIGLAEKAS